MGPMGRWPQQPLRMFPCPQVPPPAVTAPAAADSALHNLTTTQLRQEISRMDRHLQELPSDVFSSLRLSIEQSLQQAREELVSRRPEGQLLDQAIARHKQSLRARQLAETRQKQALEDLRLAETSLEQAAAAEESAQLEVARLRQQISDAEAAPAVNPGLPAATLTALFGLLQQAGLPLDQLAQVAKVVGAPPPPPPPSAAPVPPTLPTQLDHPGSQSAPPPGVFTQLMATPPQRDLHVLDAALADVPYLLAPTLWIWPRRRATLLRAAAVPLAPRIARPRSPATTPPSPPCRL